jgi:hypothetical protein
LWTHQWISPLLRSEPPWSNHLSVIRSTCFEHMGLWGILYSAKP